MRSLVTGGAGFIGSNLVDRLLELGHEVIVLDNQFSDSHDQFYWNPKAENYKLDISDYTLSRKYYDGVDYVFHLAAEARIQPSILNPIEAVRINTLGTCTALQCSKEAGVKRVMFSSTSAVYGNNPYPNVETQPDDCLNPYAVSKLAGEKLCKMFTDLYGLPTIIFRYFNVYGERQPVRGQYAPVIGIFLRQHNNCQPLTVIGDGKQSRDFVYVGDVCSANILAAITEVDPSAFGQVYNVGTGFTTTVNDIASYISEHVTYIESRPGEIKVSCSDNKKLKLTFGWKPSVNVFDWIEKHL